MRDPLGAETGIAPVYRDDPRLVPLIGPGAPFEVEPVVIDGVPLRDFVRAPRTIVDIFHMGAAHEGLVHIVLGDERHTFADVRARSRSAARELQSTFGVRPGDRVAIAMRNLPEFVTAFWAGALAGAIVVPLNSWWTGPELVYALRDAGVSVLFADDERLTRLHDTGRPDGVTLVGARSDRGDVAFADLAAGAPIADDAVARLGRDDPVTILYTSGTTGRPKGALGTNRATIANLWNMAFVAAREALITGRPPAPPRQPATLQTGSRGSSARKRSCSSTTSPRRRRGRSPRTRSGPSWLAQPEPSTAPGEWKSPLLSGVRAKLAPWRAVTISSSPTR